MNTNLSGAFAPVLTPFAQNLSVDSGRLVQHCQWLIGQGAGLAIFGTNSEANSLSVAERRRLLDHVVGAGISTDKLLPGTGCCSLPETIELTRHAVEVGAAGVLVLPPFYYKPVTDEGLTDFYARVIDAVASDQLNLLLYHIPQLTGVPITLKVIENLIRRYPTTVVGIKDSSGNWANTEAMLSEFRDFAIFPASESLLMRALPLGAAGCISATANVNPGPIAALIANWQEGDPAAHQQALDKVRKTFEQFPMIPALKAVVAAGRSDHAWAHLRPPLMPLSAQQSAALLAALGDLEFTLHEAA